MWFLLPASSLTFESHVVLHSSLDIVLTLVLQREPPHRWPGFWGRLEMLHHLEEPSSSGREKRALDTGYRNPEKRWCFLSPYFSVSLQHCSKQGIYAFFVFSQIYFRIHVSVLKLLFDKYPDVDVSVLEEHLQRASQGPFYHAEFDTDTGQGTVYRSESTASGVCNTLFFLYKNIFHKDIKADICEILRIF